MVRVPVEDPVVITIVADVIEATFCEKSEVPETPETENGLPVQVVFVPVKVTVM